MTFSIGEKLELRKNVSTIDKISLLARQHYLYVYIYIYISLQESSQGSFIVHNLAVSSIKQTVTVMVGR